MKVILKLWLICYYSLVIVTSLIFVVSDAAAQTLIVRHAPIPIIAPANVSNSVVRRTLSLTFTPSVQAPKSQALPALATPCAPVGQPAPIAAIVIGLKCDPDLIFEYVYNSIEFEPLYGSNKGALGTLLDRRGDDADQAILLVTLWNAAGYAQTGYVDEEIFAGGASVATWLGVPNDAAAIENLLSSGGIPWGDASVNPDGSLASILFLHFETALNIGGTWYDFDPSFKSHTSLSGISGLGSAIGYTRSQFLSDVGGTVGGVSISNVNRAALRSDLTTYAQNLINYVNQNNRTWSVGNVVGGKTINPIANSPIRDPGSTPLSTFPVDCPNQTTTVECRTYITITMPGALASQAIKLYTDQVYGHRVTVFSVPSGSNYVPTLLIDGAVPSCVGAGTCTNVGTPQAAGTTWSVPVTVVQPNQPTGSSCASGVTACKTLTITAGGSYLISTGTGQVGRGMAEYHRQLLAQARAAGNADTSELVLGEGLAVLGYTWLAEFSTEQQIMDRLVGTTTLYQFGVGITGQSNINQLGYQGPYVDLPINEVQIAPEVSNGPTTTIGPYAYPTALVSTFFGNAEALSAFESAVLEQTQAPVANMTAASTIKIVDANMNPSYSGALQTAYFADGTTCAGQSTFVSTIEPAISPNYNTTDYNNIVSAVMAGSANCSASPPTPPTGQQLLIPKNGKLAVGLWTGAGYTEIFPESSNSISITQKISGGMSGGFSGEDIPDPTDNFQITLPPAASLDDLDALLAPIPAPADPAIAEPVDGVTGAYIYRKNDLTTGSGRFPYALPLSRTYLSSSGTYLTANSADIGMGNGWAHNYSANVQIQSDPYAGIGSTNSPAVNSATSIVALYVLQDLLSVTPSTQTPQVQIMTISSMVARWFTDQLTGNVAMVQQPNTTEEYLAQPHTDGSTVISYNPSPGSSVRFTQTAVGQYSYARKDGVTLNFGPTPAGALQNWTFPNGMTVSLNYSGSQLTKIGNNLGRSLTLGYTGNDVTSVTDDTGRTVNYGYDSNHNLVNSTDPLGAETLYFYDVSGIYDRLGHLTQVYYPFRPGNAFVTNWYDQLGRVIQQANANGYTSNFYFAGSRSELVDALGNRHVTYQTDRGKVLKDASVLSSSYGDVFNDTAQQNGVVNVTTNQYDGLDRLTLTTLPEGGTTAYSYAAANPWANNVASITRTAKPGSTLSPLTTSFSYDLIYNKPTQITDPLGLITTQTYDASTGNLLSHVRDAGASPHFNATTLFTYDGHGKVLTSTDPNGVVNTFAYDSLENLVKRVADGGGSGHLNTTVQFSYDASGDVIARTDPNGNTTVISYDADRRLLTTTGPAPFGTRVQTTNSYDPDGHIVTVTRANGAAPNVTQASYTATGKVQTVTDPNANIATNSYDADDRLASVTDPLFRQTIYAYDAMSRRISVGNPGIQSTPLLQQSYTPDGFVGSFTDANNHTTNFTPDGFDRLATATYPDGSTETLSYDANSNVSTRKNRASATISFSYDTLNRLSVKTAPSEPTVSYAYDLASHLVGLSDNSAAITAPANSASYISSLAYDQLDRLLSVNWSPAPAQTTPTAANAHFSFAYDATNRRVGQSAADNSWWSYPTTAMNVSYTANNLNQYTAVGSISPTYDGNGNLISDGTFTYGYDAENRLISASGSGLTASYAYDAQSRRKSKTVNGTTTIFVTDANNREVLEYNGSSGAVQNWYSYGLGANGVLNQMNVASATRATFIPDVLGSFVGTLDATSGSLAKFRYQTYGESGSPNGSFAYTGQRIDPETNGLYYYHARMYIPGWGRFMQPDPIGYTGGSHLYAYVGNDPLNSVDPTGLAQDNPFSLQNENGYSAPIITNDGSQAATASGTNSQSNDQSQSGNIQLASMISPEQEAEEGFPECDFCGAPSRGGSPSVPESDFYTSPSSGSGGGEVSTPQNSGGGSGPDFVVTPGGTTVVVPPGYTTQPAQNNSGLVISPAGQSLQNDNNIIRYGEPNNLNPEGYFRYYNNYGQPIDPNTGNPGPPAATHISPSYQGPLLNYPQGVPQQ